MGHTDEEERKRSSVETSQRDVQGFIVNLLGLEEDQLIKQLKASIDNLPKDKPRLAYGLSTPGKGIVIHSSFFYFKKRVSYSLKLAYIRKNLAGSF
jgi:queuine/archaeosine tRNA-ribosyltransferase